MSSTRCSKHGWLYIRNILYEEKIKVSLILIKGQLLPIGIIIIIYKSI